MSHLTDKLKFYNKMAKARKEGKPKKNRGNVIKNLNRINKNQEFLEKYK